MRYARFKISMCAFAALVGPPYDFEQMRRARNELRDYLESQPERPLRNTFPQPGIGHVARPGLRRRGLLSLEQLPIRPARLPRPPHRC